MSRVTLPKPLVDLLGRLNWRRSETARLDLGPDTRNVAAARRFVADQCREWGGGDVADDAMLVVSELVTNAVIHAGSHCELRAGLSDAALRLQVVDHGDGMPDPQTAGSKDEHGRGLLLVSALCAAWGVEALPGGGKIVWAELLRPLREPGGDDPDRRAPTGRPVVEEAPGDPAGGVGPSSGGGRPQSRRSNAVAVARCRRHGALGRLR